MKNTNKILLLVAVIILIVASLLFLNSSKNQHDSVPSNSTDKIASNEVEIKNYSFTPQKITVKKGTTVTWENYDLVPHTVTMDDKNKKGPKSELFGKGKKFSYTFSETGKYSYHCEPHPYMKAEVTVIDK